MGAGIRPGGGREFGWALALLAASGAAALGHQVLWTRRMADLLGGGVESSARVFGSFFLGLALGAAVAAMIVSRIRRPWRVLALAELGVALLCLPVVFLPQWTGWIWPALGPENLVGRPGAAVKFALSVLLILPPAFLMGMTLPLMASVACRRGRTLSRQGIWLYASNTLGGALGLVCVVGLVVPFLGAAGSMFLVIGVNVAVAAACFIRDLAQVGPVALETPAACERPGLGDAGRQRVVLGLAFLSGAGVLAMEVLGLKLLNLKTPLAFYSPAAVLFCVVVLLGVSAAVVPLMARRWPDPGRVLSFCLALAGLAVALAPLIFVAVTEGRSGVIGHGKGVGDFLLRLGAVTCGSLGLAVLSAGLVFPLLLQWCGAATGAGAGRQLGQLLAVNGVGGILGAEAAYRLILPGTGVHVALGMVGVFYGLAAVAMVVVLPSRGPRHWAPALAALAGTTLLVTTQLEELPLFFRSSTFQVIEVHSGREGTLAVVERPDLGRGMFFDNHYLLGSSGAAPDMERQAHVPLLLHAAPERVAFLGLGTGITASGALRQGAVGSVTIVELSPLVAEAAATHFREFNRGVCVHPKVRIHIEDAGIFLASVPGQFDVVIGDLFTPWRPGEARLGALEQFRAAKAALRPGGVFCQWLPISQLSQDQLEIILATFERGFGRGYLFRHNFKAGALLLGLVGFQQGHPDWDIVARRCDSERRHGQLRDPVCRHPQGIAMLYLGACPPVADARIRLNTLDNLRLELNASRRLLAGNTAGFFRATEAPWTELLERQLTALEQVRQLPPDLEPYPRLGLEVARYEIALEREDPAANRFQRALLASLPEDMIRDATADWSLWPGHTLRP